MNEDIVVKIDRKHYRWHYDPDSESIGSWADEQTNMAPTPQIALRLNQYLLDHHTQELFDTWGKDDLIRFDAILRSIGAGEDDYLKLDLGFLLETDDAANAFPRSPLHVLGYRVGKSGKAESVRRAILKQAFLENLPNVGSVKYMAFWGIPGTAKRLGAIANHIAWKCIGSGRPGADNEQSETEWRSDLKWLKATFYDGKFEFPWLLPFAFWNIKLN